MWTLSECYRQYTNLCLHHSTYVKEYSVYTYMYVQDVPTFRVRMFIRCVCLYTHRITFNSSIHCLYMYYSINYACILYIPTGNKCVHECIARM